MLFIMDKKKKNEELQSRRDFFKKTAKSVLTVRLRVVVLGVKVKIMMLPIHQLFISELRQSARCTRLVFVPTTIIGINSIVN